MMENSKVARSMRLGMIRKLLLLLGLQNSLDSREISSETMTATAEYISKNREHLHTVFGLKDRSKTQKYSETVLVMKTTHKEGKTTRTTYDLTTLFTKDPPYIYSIDIREKFLEEPMPNTGINPAVIKEYIESNNTPINSIINHIYLQRLRIRQNRLNNPESNINKEPILCC